MEEFKEFALKGNALALAIGVISARRSARSWTRLVNDIIMPIIGIAGKADFSNYYIPLSSAVTATNLADAKKQGGVLAYGDFISVLINFLIVAAALFVVIKAINCLEQEASRRSRRSAAAEPGSRSPHPDPRPTREALSAIQRMSRRSRRALATTLNEESAIAAAATIGDNRRPNAG